MGCRGRRESEKPYRTCRCSKAVSRLSTWDIVGVAPRMERMRGEVYDVAAIADQRLHLAECDGIAAFRRSLIGALVIKNKSAGGSI